jgi:hypothetical protein
MIFDTLLYFAKECAGEAVNVEIIPKFKDKKSI